MKDNAIRRLIHGRMIELGRDEYDRFIAHAYLTTRNSRLLLSFGLPLLFVVGWLRDYAVMPAEAEQTLLRRLGLAGALFLLAGLMLVRRLGIWREAAGVAYVCFFSAGITMTTLAEPERFSLTHVAAMLMTIIVLPHAFRTATMAGMLVALSAPLVLLLVLFQAHATLWIAYIAYILVGCSIGLAQRRAYLDGALDIFLLRKRLLSRLHTDSLTGVLNREGWDVHLRRHFQGGGSGIGTAAIVYFDLDRFKAINDRAGHAAGDAVLRTAAALIQRQSRPGEVVARLGGEEFVTLLPDTDEDGAFHYAERVRKAIERESGPVALTLSAGVAQHDGDETPQATVERADLALLEAKRLGRNRVLRASRLG